MKEFKYKKLKEQYDGYKQMADDPILGAHASVRMEQILDNYPKVLELIYHLENKLLLVSELVGEDSEG